MIPFEYKPAESFDSASQQINHRESMALAGGTTMLDLMKLNVLTPEKLIFVRPILSHDIQQADGRLIIGAGCTMAQLADHSFVKAQFPAIRQSLILAASPQIRNMATIGGNLLQRTRSPYFRHPDFPADAQVKGQSNQAFGEGADSAYLAVLGNGGRLVGTYPGDFAITLVAFDADIHLQGAEGVRTVPAREFYRTPKEDQSQYTTVLKENELINAVSFPIASPAGSEQVAAKSLYFKVRERSSYAFALASASVGLVLTGSSSKPERQSIRHARVGIGGLGSIPWHSPAAETALEGQPASDATFKQAAEAALADANPPAGTAYKVKLAKASLVRALQILRDQGPLTDEQLWAMQHGRG
ncbi:Xanthine dehydrogenase YagS FAD-binding subunit [Planctomycetales bacterium 10988]|nr:Xanthine dehydrogenase YagS FAD-binding subunit [Planctomycetales bacterium 10988]